MLVVRRASTTFIHAYAAYATDLFLLLGGTGGTGVVWMLFHACSIGALCMRTCTCFYYLLYYAFSILHFTCAYALLFLLPCRYRPADYRLLALHSSLLGCLRDMYAWHCFLPAYAVLHLLLRAGLLPFLFYAGEYTLHCLHWNRLRVLLGAARCFFCHFFCGYSLMCFFLFFAACRRMYRSAQLPVFPLSCVTFVATPPACARAPAFTASPLPATTACTFLALD
jgi:hypothetical protein